MPLVQVDPVSSLNNFIDVAIKDDHNPIVNASRQRNQRTGLVSRQTSGKSTRRRSGRGSNSELARNRLDSHISNGFHEGDQNSPYSVNFDDVDLNSISSHSKARDDNDDDDGFLHPTGAVQAPLNGKCIIRENGVAALGAIAESNLRGEYDAERFMSLEQEMAKMNFEIAEARSEVDFYKMQYRQVHVEFEDLQAFCSQLQDDNKELRSGVVTRKKKPTWCKPERIRRLNQARRFMEYDHCVPQATSHVNSAHGESSHSPGPVLDEEDDWDDDTLTTNFDGASRDGFCRVGPLMAIRDRFNRSTDGSKNSRSSTDDTPKAITVTNQEDRASELLVLVDVKDDHAAWHDSMPSASGTARTEVESPSRDEQDDQLDMKAERKNGLFGKLIQSAANKNSKMKRVELDDEQAVEMVEIIQTVETTETMPGIGWNLQGRRSSFIEKHRFVPARRGSDLGINSSNIHSIYHPELDELDLRGSGHEGDEEARSSEATAAHSAVGNKEGESELKPWWKVRLNKPFQQVHTRSEKNKAWQVSSNHNKGPQLVENDDYGEDVDCGEDEKDEPLKRSSFDKHNSSRSSGTFSSESMPTDLFA
jgi:hypothetical protein